MYKINKKILCEYIWIGGKGEIRSKTRVIENTGFNEFPEWNYDASSTGQAESDGNTEGILKPVAYYTNPLRQINNYGSYLVLCETYDVSGKPFETNNRYEALRLFNSKPEEEPWYGLEQEYFIGSLCDIENVFNHYCGQGKHKFEREIAEKHLKACLEAGLKISGINSEVASKQWEFQIGPCLGIDAADQLIIARYLLQIIAEEYEVAISFSPKPNRLANGSGCHTNFSTNAMRLENGIEVIYAAMDKLKEKHGEHIAVYGEGNELRLTGAHETASYETFSWGKGTRNTSVRIPNQVVKDRCGYFEDRRPAANMDPYLVTSKIFKTCCLE
jgi:glutamine synthetase